jgi:hypothetical protein
MQTSRSGMRSIATALFFASVAAAAIAAASTAANAGPSQAVRRACANDYFAHCSMHPVNSPGVRQCMRKVGPNLSPGCLAALDQAGEIKAADRARHKPSKKRLAKN